MLWFKQDHVPICWMGLISMQYDLNARVLLWIWDTYYTIGLRDLRPISNPECFVWPVDWHDVTLIQYETPSLAHLALVPLVGSKWIHMESYYLCWWFNIGWLVFWFILYAEDKFSFWVHHLLLIYPTLDNSCHL